MQWKDLSILKIEEGNVSRVAKYVTIRCLGVVQCTSNKTGSALTSFFSLFNGDVLLE